MPIFATGACAARAFPTRVSRRGPAPRTDRGRRGGRRRAAQLAVASAAIESTRIVHFGVFTPSGEVVGVKVGRTLRGSCFSGSIGLPRPDAWRCMVGNEILGKSGGTTTDANRARRTWTVSYLKKGISPFKVEKLTQLKLFAVARAIG